MMATDTGGPAFPRLSTQWTTGTEGMSLLDLFARAMAPIHRQEDDEASSDAIAEWAYNDAEAMIAEKRKREKE